MDQPRPDRIEDGFDQQESRRFEAGYVADGTGQRQICKTYLEDAEIEKNNPIGSGRMRDRQSLWQADDKCNAIAYDHRAGGGFGALPSLSQPSQPRQREGPRQTRCDREHVPVGRIWRCLRNARRAEQEKGSAGRDG